MFYLLVYPKVAPMMDLEVPLLLVSLSHVLRSAFDWDYVILCRLDGLVVQECLLVLLVCPSFGYIRFVLTFLVGKSVFFVFCPFFLFFLG